MRCTLLLSVARVFLDQDAELVAQEKADGVTIVFRSRRRHGYANERHESMAIHRG